MCKCCEEIKFWKDNPSGVLEEKIFANISIYGWKKDVRKLKKNAKSIYITKPFALNYCPMCGRKLGGSNE